MCLLWIPIGKIILWSVLVVVAYLLILSMLNKYINFNIGSVKLINYLSIVLFFVFVLFVSLIVYILYRRGIYLSDIANKCRHNLRKIVMIKKLPAILFNLLSASIKKRKEEEKDKNNTTDIGNDEQQR